MTTQADTEDQRTLRQIEDRKIEILMEIGQINREYDTRMSALKKEYAELDAKYYAMRQDRMLSKHRA
jgi:hypothetical protein